MPNNKNKSLNQDSTYIATEQIPTHKKKKTQKKDKQPCLSKTIQNNSSKVGLKSISSNKNEENDSSNIFFIIILFCK